MKTPLDHLKDNVQASLQAKQTMLADKGLLETFHQMVEVVVRAYRAGGRLYIAGNGGSAADAQHLAAEFVSKLARPRRALPAEALTTDSSALTAIGNDFGFDKVFSRQIEGKMRSGDLFLAITTSGKSPNILSALETCRLQGFTSLLLTGRGGGPAKELADYCLVAPGDETSTIQEVHMVLYHSLCGCVEAALFPE